jgi:hypothetical protein
LVVCQLALPPGLDRSGLLNGLRHLQRSAQQPTDQTTAVGYLGSTIVIRDDASHCQFTVCPDGAQPINVADAYHGAGTTVCP